MITTSMKKQLHFLKRATAKHGKKYDYSKSIYIKAREHVIIICRDHGEFLQRPDSHLRGSGCNECGNESNRLKQKSNTPDFIKKAVAKHGNNYDYSKVNYIDNTTKVIIICKDHGEYTQQPSNHLMGKQCKLCSIENIRLKNRSNTTDFIETATKKHGKIYDYSKVNYIDNSTKVIIICSIHREFEQTPSCHLSGNGCQKCGKIKSHQSQTFTTEEFIENAMEIHGDKYDYSKVEYVNSKSNVIIICKKHGEFEQIPTSHTLQGAGCMYCGIIKATLSKTLTTEDFIENAITIHGDTYDYSKSIYTKRFELLIIICKKHGEFIQRASDHLSGNGCSRCSKRRYSMKAVKYLEFISSYYKITIQHAENEGEYMITNTNYKADGYCKETNTIYEFHGTIYHGDPRCCNPDENNYLGKNYGELHRRTLEREQCIRDLGYKLVVIWERDWDNVIRLIRKIQRKYRKSK
jgi:hypothetical protein